MKKCILIASLLLTLLALSAAAEQPGSDAILLRLPESVVADMVEKSLPLVVNQESSSLAGSISVTRINDLVFKDGSLAAAVSMQGRDVLLNTSFGGQQVRLNVGSVDLNFDLAATLRFDRDSQTLFIHPTVSGLDQQENSEVGKLIVALFNDREIPLSVDGIQPIITDIGSNELVIGARVHDVTLKRASVDILLVPETAVRKK